MALPAALMQEACFFSSPTTVPLRSWLSRAPMHSQGILQQGLLVYVAAGSQALVLVSFRVQCTIEVEGAGVVVV